MAVSLEYIIYQPRRMNPQRMNFRLLLNDEQFHRSVAWSIIGLSPMVFFLLMVWKPSTYGKLHNSNRNQQRNLFGPKVTAKWCWMIFESPNWIWALYTLLFYDEDEDDGDHYCIGRRASLPNVLLLSWFLLHYLYRSIIYPLLMSSDSKFPIGMLAFTVPYCMTNGYLQSYGLCRFQAFSANYLFSLSFILGSILTILGFTIGFISDHTLLQLRRSGSSSSSSSSSTSSYQIPYGGLFTYVSCPHFLGEMMEWVGLCIACHGSLASASFAIWTMANLLPRALAQHEWYLEKFVEEYPKTRKAVIPFIL